jgi:hypothetical protein
VVVKVPSNAGETLQLQHAAENEAELFVDLGPTYALDAADSVVYNYDSFLRYVRLVASSGITTQPTLTAAIVAKEF